jgi:hypothetical protein
VVGLLLFFGGEPAAQPWKGDRNVASGNARGKTVKRSCALEVHLNRSSSRKCRHRPKNGGSAESCPSRCVEFCYAESMHVRIGVGVAIEERRESNRSSAGNPPRSHGRETRKDGIEYEYEYEYRCAEYEDERNIIAQ